MPGPEGPVMPAQRQDWGQHRPRRIPEEWCRGLVIEGCHWGSPHWRPPSPDVGLHLADLPSDAHTALHRPPQAQEGAGVPGQEARGSWSLDTKESLAVAITSRPSSEATARSLLLAPGPNNP